MILIAGFFGVSNKGSDILADFGLNSLNDSVEEFPERDLFGLCNTGLFEIFGINNSR